MNETVDEAAVNGGVNGFSNTNRTDEQKKTGSQWTEVQSGGRLTSRFNVNKVVSVLFSLTVK